MAEKSSRAAREGLCRKALEGVGGADLDVEHAKRNVTHLRRLLTPQEQADYGIALRDIRNTKEAINRGLRLLDAAGEIFRPIVEQELFAFGYTEDHP